MAFLSLSLVNSVNRWLNIVVGAVFSAGALVTLIMTLIDGPNVVAINTAAGFVWTALIVWTAWKSKQKA